MVAGLLAGLGPVSCSGDISDPPGDPSGTTGPNGEGIGSAAPALRPLSRREVENTIADIFGLEGQAARYLPPDLFSPYDNDPSTKEASAVWVEGLETLAFEVAKQASADPSFFGKYASCKPSGPEDHTCLVDFISTLGKRLLRRPLTSAEVGAITTPALAFAKEKSDFSLAVRFAVQSLLQNPEFIYRAEIGTPKGDGQNELNSFELVTRLAYVIWGTAPDAELLAQAEAGSIDDGKLKQLAEQMLADPRADEQAIYFHRLWLGYASLRVPTDLRSGMLRESDALVRYVLTGANRAWSGLFNSPATFVDRKLAEHYGMKFEAALGAEPQWIAYAHPERAGILSHGSILSLASRNTDGTSPTIRGKFIATRLLCRNVPPPPPDVNSDDPPEADENTCKEEAYKLHREKGSGCFGCHQMMDPIGFGLERFDGLGRYRTIEKDNKNCSIKGEGELQGVGAFSGVRELSNLMLAKNELRTCAIKQLFHFSMGFSPRSADQPVVERLSASFKSSGESFRKLMLDLVTDPTFRLRVDEQAK